MFPRWRSFERKTLVDLSGHQRLSRKDPDLKSVERVSMSAHFECASKIDSFLYFARTWASSQATPFSSDRNLRKRKGKGRTSTTNTSLLFAAHYYTKTEASRVKWHQKISVLIQHVPAPRPMASFIAANTASKL